MSSQLRVFQKHVKGDLLLTFNFEASSADTALMDKFGEPEIEVGGTYFSKAELSPTISGGAITAVTVAAAGSSYTYSAQKPVVVSAVDTVGSGATFTAVLSGTGTISSVTVTAGGSGYTGGTTLQITGDHVTVYPAQKVKLWTGFPFTRRIDTISASDSTLTRLVDLYVAQVKTNVETALTTLRALNTPDRDLTKEIVYTT